MVERNPSPPREFQDEAEKFRQDMIGNTAISKKWLFATLLDLCKEVEKHGNEEKDVVDISDELQDEACRLWDLCIERDVALFLVDAKLVDLLCGIVHKSKSPRLTEILVGIFGNMSCTPEVCQSLTENDGIQQLAISLLASRDSPTLTELARLLNTCLAEKSCQHFWLDAVAKSFPDTIEDFVFILSSSSNAAVLEGLLSVLDSCLDERESMLDVCLNSDFVNAVAESGLQLFKDEETFKKIADCLHILQTLSTTESETTTFLNTNSKPFELCVKCCEAWYKMEPFLVDDDPSELAVASCLSLVNHILANSVQTASGECSTVSNITTTQRKCLCGLSQMVKEHSSQNVKEEAKQNDNSNVPKNITENGGDGRTTEEVRSDVAESSGDNTNAENTYNQISPLLEISSELLSTLQKLQWT